MPELPVETQAVGKLIARLTVAVEFLLRVEQERETNPETTRTQAAELRKLLVDVEEDVAESTDR
jgi:hypothetical protein